MKKNEHLPQTESTYKKLQPFKSVEQMNAAVKSHKQAHELTQTDRDILDAISRYSCRYYGVTYLSKAKIANDAGYKSRRTAIRSCNRLEALGIIEQYETRRIRGDLRRSSNIIVIKAVEVVQLSHELVRLSDDQQGDSHAEVTADSHRVKALNKLSSRDTYKRLEPAKPSTDSVIKRGLRHAIPTPIYDALAPFLDGQAMYDTYGILLRAKAKIDRHILLETYADRYIDAFYNVVRLHKAGKVRQFNGLLYVTWENLTAEISRQVRANITAM